MTSASPLAAFSEQTVDRLRELGSIGAGHAAGAFAQLVGRTIRMRVPAVRGRSAPAPGPEPRPFDTGVLFEIEGGPGGVVAILFSAHARDALLRVLLGRRADKGPEAESALREVGNILASSVVSAIADTLGTRVLPSVPVLALEGASAALASLVEARGQLASLRIETEIFDRDEELRGLVVFVPGATA